MPHRHYSTEGVILSLKKTGEGDKIVVIYTKDYGKKHFLAKGISKPKSRKRSSFDLFNTVRFSASNSHTYDYIEEVEIISNNKQINKSLKKMAVGYFFAEVLLKILSDSEKNEEIYTFVVEYYKKLGKSVNLKLLRQEFSKNLLVLLGYIEANTIIQNYDLLIQNIIEKRLFSIEIGKKIIQ